MLIRRQDHWLTVNIGGEVVMMNAQNGKHIGLNKVGARIWDILEKPQTFDEICRVLVQRFKVTPDACHASVERFIGELAKQGAIVIVAPETASTSVVG